MFNPYILLAALAAFILSGVGGYWKGHSDADQSARLKEIQTALDAAYQDLNAQRLAAEMQRKAADDNRRAAEQAERIADEYEAELKARGEASACRLTGDDLRRLQRNAIGSDTAAPARR